MPTRHQLRIAAMQALFQLDVQGESFLKLLDDFLRGSDLDGESLQFAAGLVQRYWTHRRSIDDAIAGAAQHWDLSRISGIDRAILRLAVGELLHATDVPPKVAINEAVELAKVFGAAESPKFVNGVLDGIWKHRQLEKPGHLNSNTAAEPDRPSAD